VFAKSDNLVGKFETTIGKITAVIIFAKFFDKKVHSFDVEGCRFKKMQSCWVRQDSLGGQLRGVSKQMSAIERSVHLLLS
jgi:hypothetical protein